MTNFNKVLDDLKTVLDNAEAMEHPVIGPTARQLARLMEAQLKGQSVSLKWSNVMTAKDITPQEAKGLCEDGRALALEMAGAYSALSRLLPDFVRVIRGEM